jgi:hypothetical protein
MVSMMRKVASILGLILGLFLIARAIVEPFVIDFSQPSTNRSDWGGPSLAGVLLVQCGPGLLAAAAIVAVARRSLRSSQPTPGGPQAERRR